MQLKSSTLEWQSPLGSHVSIFSMSLCLLTLLDSITWPLCVFCSQASLITLPKKGYIWLCVYFISNLMYHTHFHIFSAHFIEVFMMSFGVFGPAPPPRSDDTAAVPRPLHQISASHEFNLCIYLHFFPRLSALLCLSSISIACQIEYKYLYIFRYNVFICVGVLLSFGQFNFGWWVTVCAGLWLAVVAFFSCLSVAVSLRFDLLIRIGKREAVSLSSQVECSSSHFIRSCEVFLESRYFLRLSIVLLSVETTCLPRCSFFLKSLWFAAAGGVAQVKFLQAPTM